MNSDFSSRDNSINNLENDFMNIYQNAKRLRDKLEQNGGYHYDSEESDNNYGNMNLVGGRENKRLKLTQEIAKKLREKYSDIPYKHLIKIASNIIDSAIKNMGDSEINEKLIENAHKIADNAATFIDEYRKSDLATALSNSSVASNSSKNKPYRTTHKNKSSFRNSNNTESSLINDDHHSVASNSMNIVKSLSSNKSSSRSMNQSTHRPNKSDSESNSSHSSLSSHHTDSESENNSAHKMNSRKMNSSSRRTNTDSESENNTTHKMNSSSHRSDDSESGHRSTNKSSKSSQKGGSSINQDYKNYLSKLF